LFIHPFWHDDKPTKAYQLKQLAIIALVFQLFVWNSLCTIGTFIGRTPGPQLIMRAIAGSLSLLFLFGLVYLIWSATKTK
jgi:hypothetical protein